MERDDPGLIGPDETAFTLDLTREQLKVTYTALKIMLDDFGHEEAHEQRLIREVLAKLPPEDSIRLIDLDIEDEARRRRAG